ncbi:MAG: hypothetical protein ACK55I_42935, partial [bacterium]
GDHAREHGPRHPLRRLAHPRRIEDQDGDADRDHHEDCAQNDESHGLTNDAEEKTTGRETKFTMLAAGMPRRRAHDGVDVDPCLAVTLLRGTRKFPRQERQSLSPSPSGRGL